MRNPPLVPNTELMLITDPCPDAASAAAAVFIPRNTPVWPVSIVRCQSSSDVSSIPARSAMPALFTRMSRPPNSRTRR